MADDPPTPVPDTPLAEGIDRYIARFREGQRAGDGSLASARLASDLAAEQFPGPTAPELARCTSFIVCPDREIAVHIHRPPADAPLPAILYIHGGGFVFGSIESFDGLAKALAAECRALVVSVHYRRLPESSVAEAQGDCEAALDWLIDQAAVLGVDPDRVAIAGDSVGALLATTTAMRARHRGIRLAAQLLLYGAYAMREGRADYAASRDPLLTGDRVEAFIAAWRKGGGPDHHPAPLDVTDLAGLPPAVMLAAELDPLRAESLDFADRLRAAGVPVTHRVAPGMIHGFLRAMSLSPPAAHEMTLLADTLRPFLSQPETKS